MRDVRRFGMRTAEPLEDIRLADVDAPSRLLRTLYELRRSPTGGDRRDSARVPL